MTTNIDKPTNNFWGYMVVAGLLALLAMLAFDQPVLKETLVAEVVGVSAPPSDTPESSLLTAKLPSGHVVEVAGSARLPRAIGSKIRVQKVEREIFGLASFHFVEFLEDELND